MPRPIRATIHTAHLAHNLARAKQLSCGAQVFAVVKANAYGHGIDIAPIAFAAADGLALIEIENAVKLRELGWTKPILLLEGCFTDDDWLLTIKHRLSVVLHSAAHLSKLETLRIPSSAQRLNVFLKFNTGMNRLGFPIESQPELVARTRACDAVASVTLMTHFACADTAQGYVAPLKLLNDAALSTALPRSVANSAACFDIPTVIDGNLARPGDWTRPGIMLYGATPFTHASRPAADLGLKAGMSLNTEIIGVQTLKPGDAVGYGGTYIAQTHERIAVIAAGYADGYPRHAPSGTPILVDGIRTNVVGRVSMDKITVNISHLPEARIGTPVELFGEQLAVDEVANAAQTIGYELLTAVAPRVPRIVT